ncbi:hypothetical protein [Granulicoccus sp. GXG6511]|uniref:hypothetical protein n=1 Tax=Granulicoccus sp. GXG6511 TaxID=3381351 RepID=UPI003D7E18AA
MELSGIKRLLVPAASVLVGALVVVQLAMVAALITGRGFTFDSSLAWLPMLLAIVLGLATVWGGARAEARPAMVGAIVATVTAAIVLLVTWIVPTAEAWSLLSFGTVVTWTLFLVSTLAVQVLALVLLVRLLPLTRASGATSETPALPSAGLPELPGDEQSGRAPVWQPDRAAGAHWHTAGAAAAGAAAADWGRPGERGGWAPPPRAPEEFGPQEFGPKQLGQAPDPDVTRISPEPRRVGGTDPAAGSGRTVDFGPQALARRYAEGEEDMTRPAPPGTRRQPPRWTPLEDPTQPPPQA